MRTFLLYQNNGSSPQVSEGNLMLSLRVRLLHLCREINSRTESLVTRLLDITSERVNSWRRAGKRVSRWEEKVYHSFFFFFPYYHSFTLLLKKNYKITKEKQSLLSCKQEQIIVYKIMAIGC